MVASLIAKNTYSLFRHQSESRGEITAFTEEMLGNLKVVKAFSREENAQAQFEKINDTLSQYSFKATFVSSLVNPSTRFVNSLVYAAVGVSGAVMAIRALVTVGELVSFLSYANQYTKPFNEISGVVTELQNAMSQLEGAGKSFFWLNVFGMPEYQLNQLLDQMHRLEQTVKAKLVELEHGITYCVVCTADNFGSNYTKLQNELKGELSKLGCSFVDDAENADYVIRVEASAREYNKMTTAGGSAYFSYVDAAVAIDKNATGQRIFEDEISVKGSHTIGFEEAGRDGYKKVGKEISNLLKENIKQ